jgi:hypothetical protein
MPEIKLEIRVHQIKKEKSKKTPPYQKQANLLKIKSKAMGA